MATLTYGFNPSFLPFNDRDQEALNSMFEGIDEDPLREIETVLNQTWGGRSPRKGDRPQNSGRVRPY